jgi:hypothetical protein
MVIILSHSAKYRIFLCRLVTVIGVFLWHSSLDAQERNSSIQYELTPYLWVATIDGTLVVSGDEAPPIDSGYNFFSLDNLDGVASTKFTAQGQHWGFLFDFLYVAYEDTLLPGTILQVRPRLEGRILEYAVTYKSKSANELQLITGIRQQDIDAELEIVTRSPQASVNWFDPFVGGIYSSSLANKLTLSLRGDVGGFGIESKLAVNVEAMLRYQLGNTFSFKFGYRYLKVDFEDNRLVYDVSLDGFQFGLGIRF